MRNNSSFAVCMLLLVFNISCKDNGSVETEPLGNYIFVERTIITDATLLRGDPSWIPVVVIEPSIRYTFDSQTKTLSGSAKLPINQDLQLIFGDRHFYLLPHLPTGKQSLGNKRHTLSHALADTAWDITIGALFWLTPMYFFPHYIDPSTVVTEIGSNGLVGMVLSGVSPQLNLRPDSVYIRVTTRIDSVLQSGGGSGNWAVFEFKDSLTIRNYGFQPKEKVIWNPMSN